MTLIHTNCDYSKSTADIPGRNCEIVVKVHQRGNWAQWLSFTILGVMLGTVLLWSNPGSADGGDGYHRGSGGSGYSMMGGPGAMMGNHHNSMGDLKLTRDQRKKFDHLREAMRNQFEKMHDDDSTNSTIRQAHMDAARKFWLQPELNASDIASFHQTQMQAMQAHMLSMQTQMHSQQIDQAMADFHNSLDDEQRTKFAESMSMPGFGKGGRHGRGRHDDDDDHHDGWFDGWFKDKK